MPRKNKHESSDDEDLASSDESAVESGSDAEVMPLKGSRSRGAIARPARIQEEKQAEPKRARKAPAPKKPKVGIFCDKTSVPVKDQDAALAFWTEKVGFVKTEDQPMGPSRWIEVRPSTGGHAIVLSSMESDKPNIGKFSALLFSCQNVQASYDDLKAKGVEFTQEPKTEPWGTMAIFKDLDGNTFCLANHTKQ